MPRIYIHFGIGSVPYQRGDITIARDAASGSTVSISAEPAQGWQFSYARVGDAEQRTDPVTFTMPPRDENVYMFYTAQVVILPELPPPPPEPKQPPSDMMKMGERGARCDLLRQIWPGNDFFFLYNRYTGKLSHGYDEVRDMPADLVETIGCNIPAPETPQDWQQGISDTIGDLVGSVRAALGGFSERLQKIDDFLAGFWEKLEAWLVERLVALMLRALDREVEEAQK